MTGDSYWGPEGSWISSVTVYFSINCNVHPGNRQFGTKNASVNTCHCWGGGNKHLPCNNELNMLLSFVGDSKHTFRRGQLFLMVLQWGFITTMLWFLFCFECM